ncbi:hypothetical protein NW762_008883 [Fusarium torreyae]|uniref:Heterokaryon incompatibility domain-containing protein n=1 Tax=Fusarium torreyae TaxID=1237075 RepID=A0A9W8VCX8_9HYPO|nr:hypothetical protein NW762_008883 [Fusarium torreyae]
MEVGHAQSLYQPLNTNRHEIRLLEILSESPNDKVECKLHTVPLTPETYYVCLSYVWGDPSVTEEITVDGFPRQVTVNLATALRHLKKHWMEIELESDSNLDTSKFRLWADAVCINQDDIAERSAQVSMMANIYSSAEMVLAWISSDDGDISRAFDIFERIGAAVREDWDAESDHTPLPLTDLKFEIRAMKVPKDNPRFSWLFPEKSVLFDRESNHFRSYEPHYYIHFTHLNATSGTWETWTVDFRVP